MNKTGARGRKNSELTHGRVDALLSLNVSRMVPQSTCGVVRADQKSAGPFAQSREWRRNLPGNGLGRGLDGRQGSSSTGRRVRAPYGVR